MLVTDTILKKQRTPEATETLINSDTASKGHHSLKEIKAARSVNALCDTKFDNSMKAEEPTSSFKNNDQTTYKALPTESSENIYRNVRDSAIYSNNISQKASMAKNSR